MGKSQAGGGFDLSSLLNFGGYAGLAGGLLTAGGQIAEGVISKEDADRAAAEAVARANALVATDAAYARAESARLTAESIYGVSGGKAAKNAAAYAQRLASARSAAQAAKAAFEGTLAGVPAEAAAKRLDAARGALTLARQQLTGRADIAKQNLVRAWESILAVLDPQSAPARAKAEAAASRPYDDAKSPVSIFLRDDLIKRVPNVAVVGGGLGAAGLVYLLVRHLSKRSK